MIVSALAVLVSSTPFASHHESNVATQKLLADAHALEGEVKQSVHSKSKVGLLEEDAQLMLAIITWNVGNEIPDVNALSEFFDERIEIVVVGVQECATMTGKYFGKYLDEAAHAKGFARELSQSLPNTIALAKQIKVYLYKRTTSHRDIHQVSGIIVQTTNWGLLTLGFKGGAGLVVDIDGNRFTFLSTHLAAHMRKMYRRNSDAAAILKGTNVINTNFEATTTSDHVFLFGDFNYRVDPHLVDYKEYDEEDDQRQRYFAEDYKTVRDAIDVSDISLLTSYDQLIDQQQLGNVFVNFQEQKIKFLPTFKVIKHRLEGYSNKRIPSFCDRVLWHSLPGVENDVHQLVYTSMPQIITSDHKPVIATFAVDLSPAPAVGNPIRVDVEFEIQGLPHHSKTLTVVALGYPLEIGKENTLTGRDGESIIQGRFNLQAELPVRSSRAHIVFAARLGLEKLGEIAVPLKGFSGDLFEKSGKMYLASQATGLKAKVTLLQR